MADQGIDILLCKVGGRYCALRLASVVETMRPLEIQPVEGALPCMLGLSVIRGRPCPVLDLGRLLGGGGEPERLVLLRLEGERRVALAVSGVEGVRRASLQTLSEMPPLMTTANPDLVEAIATQDSELMLILRAGALMSPSDWAVLEA